MQFFGIAFNNMDLQSLIKEWTNSEFQLDVYKMFYEDIERKKDDMLRLLPENLKNKIFDNEGNIKKNILSDDLYIEMVKYKEMFHHEWNKACQSVNDENKRIETTLPKSIKKLAELMMHDEEVVSIYLQNNNELVVELKERSWGKRLLVFKGIEKADIPNDVYPTWWLYDELFRVDNNKYEFNVLFSNGEFSITFDNFDIVIQTQKYIYKIIEKFSQEAVETKVDEIIKESIEKDGDKVQENTTSSFINSTFDGREFFHAVSSCVSEKKHFAGSGSLNEMEQNILLLGNVIMNLIYDLLNPELGLIAGGIHKLATFPKVKLDEIIDSLSRTGPEYLYKIILESKNVFEISNEEEKLEKIKSLNNRMNLRYGVRGSEADEIFNSFANYIKMNVDKF